MIGKINDQAGHRVLLASTATIAGIYLLLAGCALFEDAGDAITEPLLVAGEEYCTLREELRQIHRAAWDGRTQDRGFHFRIECLTE